MVKLAVLLLLLDQQAPLRLQDCIREAIRRHPDVTVAATDVERARALKTGTQAGYLPSLYLTLQNSYSVNGRTEAQTIQTAYGAFTEKAQDTSGDDFHSFGLTLSQNILDGGKWWNRIDRADQEIRRTEVSLAVTRDDVALRVISAYFEVLKAERQQGVLEEAVTRSEGQLRLADEQRKLGAASKVDVAKARVSLGEDRIALENQRGIVDTTLVDLNVAMGRSPAEPVTVQDVDTDEPGASPPQPPAVLAGHARLQENMLAQSVASLDTLIAKGDRYPALKGSISFLRQDTDFYKVYSRFDELYILQFMLTLSFPIFDGFLTKSNIEGAEAQESQLRQRQTAVQQDLDSRLTKAINDQRRLAEVARMQRENVSAAEEQLELARERYKIGDGTELEVRDAQLAVTRAKLAEVQSRFDLKGAAARYHYARGDLLEIYLSKEHP